MRLSWMQVVDRAKMGSTRNHSRYRAIVCVLFTSSFTLVFLNRWQWQSTNGVTSHILVEDGLSHPTGSCTEEYMNTNRLEQDHPCVIEIIRKHYLRPPPSPDVPYHLQRPDVADPSPGQTTFVLNKLLYPMNGFFVDVGAFNGENSSNTLYMEKVLDWKGILIEPNPTSYELLKTKNRRAWSLPACISIKPYPALVRFQVVNYTGSIVDDEADNSRIADSNSIIKAQCFPLYSILLAVNRTQVDFISLDVEGFELEVLKTIPWRKLDIKTLAVNWRQVQEKGEKALIRYMKGEGYLLFGRLAYGSKNLLFISPKQVDY